MAIENRRAFLRRAGRTALTGGIVATPGASALLAACVPTPDRRTPEQIHADAAKALQQHIDAVRSPDPRTLAQVFADEESMYLQAGRTFKAIYGSTENPQATYVLMEGNRYKPQSETVWNAISEAFGYGRYALVETTSADGGKKVDFVGIPPYSEVQRMPAVIIPYDFLVDTAIERFINGPFAFTGYGNALKGGLAQGDAVRMVRLVPPNATKAMHAIHSELARVLPIDPVTRRGPSVSLRAYSISGFQDPHPRIDIFTDGNFDMAGLFRHAEDIASMHLLRARHVRYNPDPVPRDTFTPYLTFDVIRAAARQSDIPLAPYNHAPESVEAYEPLRFIQLVLRGQGKFGQEDIKYLLYITPVSAAR